MDLLNFMIGPSNYTKFIPFNLFDSKGRLFLKAEYLRGKMGIKRVRTRK
jgi:hypothetical protein